MHFKVMSHFIVRNCLDDCSLQLRCRRDRATAPPRRTVTELLDGSVAKRDRGRPGEGCGVPASAGPGCVVAQLLRSKVNVQVTDPTYLPANAVFKNLVEARDDVLRVVTAKHRRRAVPTVLHR